jgi:tRNA dimethylallyltransferase
LTEEKKKLVAIVGPTATGKSALALHLSQRLPGAEIISADSRQVYRLMDIGTAKPTMAERRQVPHHLIDVADVDQEFSLADYQRLAFQAIDGAEQPLLVGGTGLYVRSVTAGFVLPDAPPDRQLRQAQLSQEELLARLAEADPVAAEAIDPANRRRLERALERAGAAAPPPHRRYHTLMIGLTADRDELYRRADERVDRMMAAGWLEEVRGLLERYPQDLPALSGLGYAEIGAHLRGELSLAEAIDHTKRRTRRYIKRQLTWFKRDSDIHWLDVTRAGWMAEAAELVGTLWPALGPPGGPG